MMKNRTLTLATVIAALSIASFAAGLGINGLFAETGADTSKAAPQERHESASGSQESRILSIAPDDHVYGDPKATISLIVWSDFECPFCARYDGTPQSVVDESDGRVNMVFRHFPLPFHGEAALSEANAAECAAEQGGDAAFWSFVKAVFKATEGNGQGVPGGPMAVAADQGLNSEAFATCLGSGRYAELIEKDINDGRTIGIRGTPGTLIVNRESMRAQSVPGQMGADKLRSIIDSLSGPAEDD